MAKSIQKVIKVGSSAAVTIPAKTMKQMGVKVGDEIQVDYEPILQTDPKKVELVELTQKLIKRHKKALDNLAKR